MVTGSRGRADESEDEKGVCGIGHRGILCNDCEIGYSQNQAYQCKKCANVALDIFFVFLTFLFIAVMCAFVIRYRMDTLIIIDHQFPLPNQKKIWKNNSFQYVAGFC